MSRLYDDEAALVVPAIHEAWGDLGNAIIFFGAGNMKVENAILEQLFIDGIEHVLIIDSLYDPVNWVSDGELVESVEKDPAVCEGYHVLQFSSAGEARYYLEGHVEVRVGCVVACNVQVAQYQQFGIEEDTEARTLVSVLNSLTRMYGDASYAGLLQKCAPSNYVRYNFFVREGIPPENTDVLCTPCSDTGREYAHKIVQELIDLQIKFYRHFGYGMIDNARMMDPDTRGATCARQGIIDILISKLGGPLTMYACHAAHLENAEWSPEETFSVTVFISMIDKIGTVAQSQVDEGLLCTFGTRFHM